MTLRVYKPRALDLATHTHNRHLQNTDTILFLLSPVSPTFRTIYNLSLSLYALIGPKPCFPSEGVEPSSISLAH
jgi:hypothetical protein